MKILLINGGCLERTGVCLFTYEWAHSLITHFPGNTVTVYFKRTIVDKALYAAFEEDGIRVISGNHSEKGTFTNRSNREGIKNDLKKIFQEKYDIVHIHSSVLGFTSLVLEEASRANVPVRIAHAHGKFEESFPKTLIHNILRCYIRRRATAYAGCSTEAGRYLFGDRGIQSPRWRMVLNAIQTGNYTFNKDKRKTYRDKLNISEAQLLLGAVGYLDEVKNHTFLIDVMAGLKKRGVQAKLIILGDGRLKARCIKELDEGIRHFELIYDGILLEILEELGTMPLPPYIHEKLADQNRYQTVYAKEVGSAAAPTAGLHFTKDLLKKIEEKGIDICYVTLHVGLGTFRPVSVENIEEHEMHSEFYTMSKEVADKLNLAKSEKRRIIAVGTTSTRTLETIMSLYGEFKECSGWTSIFIYPGYEFKGIDCLITNFHLPKSTLVMLVSALAGRDNILNAYKIAVDEKYRFFSFGDAMFIK